MDELKLKKHQRQAVRLNANKEITKANEFLEAGNLDIDKTRVTIEKLRDYRARLQNFDSDINITIDVEALAMEETQKSMDLDDLLLETTLTLSTKLEALQSAEVESRAASSHVGSHEISTDRRHRSVHLPKLQLSRFSGDPLKFQEFWDSYKSTVHENDDLSDVDKFKYLRSFLSGDALRLVDGYRLTSANYQSAVETLTERFGNEQIAVFSHIDALLALPTVNHDISQLQSVYDECEKHIRSLVALGRTEDTFGQFFTPIILSKLPVFVKMELHRKNGSQPWTLSNLREFLKEEIRARDMSQRNFGGGQSNGGMSARRSVPSGGSSGNSNRSMEQSKTRFSKGPSHNTASSLLTNDTKKKVNCSFCNGNHFTDQCTKYPDVPSRRSQMKGRCLSCLSTRHSVKNCSTSIPCAHCHKTGHHRSLCYMMFGSKSATSGQDTSLHVTEETIAPYTNSILLSHGQSTILQTALADVVGKSTSQTAKARILFDTGCSRSFITTSLAKRIGARPRDSETISMAGFGDTMRKNATYKAVDFDVILVGGQKKTISANLIRDISCPIQKFPLDVKHLPFVSQLVLAEPIVDSPKMVDIDILLGIDYYYEFIGRDRFHCSNGVIFLSSLLGFIATGRIDAKPVDCQQVSSLILSKLDPCPYSTLHIERYWSLEDIGVKTPISTNDDEDALKNFNDTVRFEDGRYQVTLPYKSDHPELSENCSLARRRFVSNMKRVGSDKKLLELYNKTIVDQLEKGVIEEAPLIPDSDKVHYVPHHGVVTPGKVTTKLRIVYDASAKATKISPSLNECLNRGPVMLDDLCGLLLRFRLHKVGLSSDIEKAFLQIGLQKSSRDVTRFFWVRDTNQPPVGENVVVYRFCRVPFGFVPSPFLLAAVIDHHIKKSVSSAAVDINGNIYVDNVILGKDTTDEAIQFYHEAKQMFREASMNLREWYSNSKEVLDVLSPNDRGSSSLTKVLGLQWDTKEDTLACSFDVAKSDVNTKRTMLRCLASVFDPCGYFSAVTVSGKLLIQALWKQDYNWDDKLPPDILKSWDTCAASLQQIKTKNIPRCILPNEVSTSNTTFQLHCFSDASAKAYAAVIYLRGTSNGTSFSNLVFAKSRVAPTKELSIPRLELMGVLIGVRLMSFVVEQLRVDVAEKYLWSDSQCVLHWIVKKSVSTKFVKNRIDEIKRHSSVHFRYVPTAVNPADMSSRGCSFESICDNSLWWHGPTWLLAEKDKWPANPIAASQVDDTVSDEDCYCDPLTKTTAMPAVTEVDNDPIPVDRFSSLTRLLRVTGWMLRFVKNAGLQHGKRQSGDLSTGELAIAESVWERKIQRVHFADVLDKRGGNKTTALVKQLGLFVDNLGVIRCGGRLDNADLPYDAKHPKLLPKKDNFTDLVIRDCHVRLFHSGVTHTLSQVRYKYWIVQGRVQVKQVVKSCRLCRFLDGGAYRTPPSPPLPAFRLGKSSPFCCTGLDYLGPLHVKSRSSDTIVKCWLCLFTCAVTRAIHLEVIEDLTSAQFLLCFRRFISVYGAPEIIVSDNAKTFHASNRFLEKLWRDRVRLVPEFCTSNGIRWKFITELSPWMGGFYERMVGIVKRSLKKSVDNRCVSFVELQTVSSEISSIVNSRPLVYSESDVSAPPLTPSHFLGGFRSKGRLPSFANEPDADFVREGATAESLTKHWKRVEQMLDSFWSSWRSEYLLNLRNMKTVYFKDRNVRDSSPTVGSVVIVRDDLPRSHWRMGRITKLRESQDGVCRSATVRLSNGKMINRAIRMLYPLEIDCLEPDDAGSVLSKTDERPKRQAAISAGQRLRNTTMPSESSDSE